MESKIVVSEALYDRILNIKSLMINAIFLFEIALYLLSFISFFYFVVLGIKMKALKCIIVVTLLLGYRLVQLIFNIKLHDLLKLSVLIFIFMAMFLAETLNFYAKITIFDKILHSFSGVMLFFLGQALFKRLANSPKSLQNNTSIMILFSIFFSIALAGCWEIFEFTLDRITGYHLQKDSLMDTMGDIICGTTMAIMSGIFYLVLIRVKKVNVAKEYLIDEIQNDYFEKVNINE